MNYIFNTPIGIILISTICVSAVLTLSIILIKSFKKTRKNVYIKNNINYIDMSPKGISQYLCSHKFFTVVKCAYVERDFNFTYPVYDTLLESHLKTENKVLIEFKKTLANKFLSDCLFKYLNESTESWIKAIVEEISKVSEKEIVKADYTPTSIYIINEYLTHFSKTTEEISETLHIEFKDSVLNGMPQEFVKQFCKTVSKNINSIQNSFGNILYSNNFWVDKIVEILDLYELALDYIKMGVDSTLVVMNGQMKRYVERYIDN